MPMPREGNVARGDKGEYAVCRILKAGDTAVASEARETGTGRTVFLKLYNAPKSRCEWFRPYLAYERELNARLEKDDYLRDVAVPAIEVFATPLRGADGTPLSKHPSVFQVFRWVEGGRTLKDRIAPATSWAERVYLAKIFLSALARLHDRNVVHCDLKPENVGLQPFVLPDGEERLRPTLLDMDFSILSDRTAPWHGKAGYTGTPGYHSPEHLRGEVPQKASDVFTAAVILCELLAGRHPFASAFDGETDELKRRMREGETDFAGGIPLLGSPGGALPGLLERALSPNPEDRPAAKEFAMELSRVRHSLSGGGRLTLPPDSGTPAAKARETERAAMKPAEPEAKPVATADKGAALSDKPRAPVAASASAAPKLVLRGKAGAIRTRTMLAPGRALLVRAVGDEARFTDGRPQFEVVPEGGRWTVRPTRPRNPTFLNGAPLRAPAVLKPGDVLSILSVYAKLTVSFAA